MSRADRLQAEMVRDLEAAGFRGVSVRVEVSRSRRARLEAAGACDPCGSKAWELARGAIARWQDGTGLAPAGIWSTADSYAGPGRVAFTLVQECPEQGDTR